jgi:HSP20 family protein
MTMMTQYEPFGSVLPLRDAIDQLFRESFVTPLAHLAQTTSSMPVDVYELDDDVVVKASVPGLTPDELTVDVEQQSVTLHGKPKTEENSGMRPLLQERRIGSFTRTFTLPVPVEADKVQAELSDGVLSLIVPKSEAIKPRKITIQSS